MLLPLMTASAISLDDKYRRDAGRIYLTGTQALVRMLLVQRRRDRAQGITSAGFVSGYRGSPLGSIDRELWRAQPLLDEHDIRFWPGVNEDLAATALWGTQMTNRRADARVQGVFGMWYGKGAGLDRSGDAMRHAVASGTSPHGGVLVVVGDDHAQKSSTQPYFSEPTFADLLIPVLYPAGVGEVLQYGILGWALSRFSGAWVGFKTMAEVLDCSTSLDDDSFALDIARPTDSVPPPGSVHFRWPDPWQQGEIRWIEHRLPAVHAFVRANAVNRVALSSPRPRFGIVTAGKSYCDLLQAMADMGLSAAQAADLGITIYKIGMTWPLETSGVRKFAAGLEEILVIEEKRPVIEDQLRAALSDVRDRPLISGKKDAAGEWQFPWVGELGPDRIVRVLVAKLAKYGLPVTARARLAAIDQSTAELGMPRPKLARPPYFCPGCPHNTSTNVPEGSEAIGGVGCHYMAVDMERHNSTFSHMGGEGATWIGQAPFTRTAHTFVNLGEGTYFHSGSLAIRACLAAGVNITYKLLYNDAVAMTGGQPVDGKLSVPQLAQQLFAEGVRNIRIVAEEPQRYREVRDLPPGTQVHERRELDSVQRELRAIPGVTVLIFDQTCAAEKRRRRKRRELEDPPRRAFINTAVCEGCGDCSRVSNCLAVVPVETELGRKRAIDQSSCNKDLSCLQGFCPSFVTVIGGDRAQPQLTQPSERLPDPLLPVIRDSCDIFIAGVGGTGVVTVGALLGMAAHLEGKTCVILDQLGMAQKGGAVVTHLRIGNPGASLATPRVPTAGADLLLGVDLLVSLQDQAFSKLCRGRTHAILNTHESVTGEFTRNADAIQPTEAMVECIAQALGNDHVDAFDATRLATALVGDSIATNLFVLGYAFQKGRIPLAEASILEAIRLNGAGVETNLVTFRWGRLAALDRGALEAIAFPRASAARPDTHDTLVEHRAALLAAYQNPVYAERFRDFLRTVSAAEASRVSGQTALADAVARALYKLMAYKDEYEVARLYTDGAFVKAVAANFSGRYRLQFHMAPPLLAKRNPNTGLPEKHAFGAWLLPVLRVLARLRVLRGTPFDPFGYTRERRMERALIEEYRASIERLLAALNERNHELAVAIAELPLAMRGFGHIKEGNVAAARAQRAQLEEQFRALSGDAARLSAAEVSVSG